MSVTRTPHGAGSQPNGDPACGSQQLDLITLLCGPASAVEKFRDFNERHPHIYRILVERTREYLRRTGRSKVGIALIWEVMRWDVAVQTGEAPKLNNDLKAYFARLIMLREPDLVGVFETRRSAADNNLGVAA